MSDEINEFDGEFENGDMGMDMDNQFVPYDEAYKIPDSLTEIQRYIEDAEKHVLGGYKIDKEYLLGVIQDILNDYPRQLEDAKNILEHEKRIISAAEAEADKTRARAKEEAELLVSTDEIKNRARIEAEQIENITIEKTNKLKRDAVDAATEVIKTTIEELEISLRNFADEEKRIENEMKKTRQMISTEINELSKVQTNIHELLNK